MKDNINNEPNPVTTSIKELLRRTDMTCNARYNAAVRMSLHGWASQWTLAILVVGQIAISLIASLNVHKNFSNDYINFGSIFFGVLVLAYSLLLGMADFSSRSVKLHSCGLELGRLSRKLFYLSQSNDESLENYEKCYTQYYDILDKYENHSPIDYLQAHHKYYIGEALKLNVETLIYWTERLRLFRIWLKIWIYRFLQFSHYAISISLISAWIFVLVRK